MMIVLPLKISELFNIIAMMKYSFIVIMPIRGVINILLLPFVVLGKFLFCNYIFQDD